MAWLKTAGSKAGQEAFNPVKGSICARTDCDKTLFNAYLQTAMADWATDTVVGSPDPRRGRPTRPGRPKSTPPLACSWRTRTWPPSSRRWSRAAAERPW